MHYARFSLIIYLTFNFMSVRNLGNINKYSNNVKPINLLYIWVMAIIVIF